MFKRIWVLLTLLTFTAPAFAIGATIAAILVTEGILIAGSFAAAATAFAINMVVSAVVSYGLSAAFGASGSNGDGNLGSPGNTPDLGNRLQLSPATDNKLPVVYGTAWVGGIITDLSITEDNQNLYYVLSLCEVTGVSSPDTITFGDIYYGGKKVVFDTNGYSVLKLVDESTGVEDTTVAGKIDIYLYSNGSNQPANNSQSAISIMQASGLTYTWDNTKLMSNCAFAIIHLRYSVTANIRGINQTKFQVTNSRTSPGDVLVDYLQNTRYGGGIPSTQIDSTSIQELNTYCAQAMTYTTYSGTTSTLTRFKFDGVVDTKRAIMDNLQDMASSCDCLIKYNEITAKWGVIVQKPTYTVAMNVDDSNIISGISISPMDLASSYNIVECKFPDSTNQDSFNTATFDLATIDPSLLFPNEPINKMSISLPFVNNNVRAQYIANRLLKTAREDLNVQFDLAFTGLQLEAGDVISVTNVNYGWDNKLFRLNKVQETFNDDGSIVVKLNMSEFNASIWDDVNITQFTPSTNTGIGDPTFFGTVPAPTISNQQPNAAIPSFNVNATTSSSGIIQYAEIWYSAFAYPTESQRIFAGVTATQSNGNPYNPNTALPPVTLTGIPSGQWYFFSRMVNSLASSQFSSASTLLNWGPTTYQFEQRYLMVAYADNQSGGGFSLYPTNKDWYGLCNQSTSNPVTNPTAYTWYPASPAFGTTNFLLYINRQNRKFSFASGAAVYASQTGAYVPADTASYDQSLWSALPVTTNYIDLDARTGQLLQVGTSSVSASDGLIRVTNTQNGTVVAALERFLNFGAGVQYKTSPVANLTIDIYGRVVGFTSPDNFYFTETTFTAIAGQTSFSLSHTVGNILIFRNGILLDADDYTESGSGFVLDNPCTAGMHIVVLNMRAETTDIYYEPLNISIASSTTNSVTYASGSNPYQYINAGDQLCFSNTGSPTTYTVASVNYSTRVITFTGTISGATAGLTIYNYRAASTSYPPFSRFTTTLTSQNSYTPTEWSFRSGFELIFLNGSAFNALDYDITDGALTALPSPASGLLTVIQFNENNLSVPCANCANSIQTTQEGITEYAFAHNVDAFVLYANGSLLAEDYDYTDTSSIYTLLETPNNSYTVLQQQTFARVGAA